MAGRTLADEARELYLLPPAAFTAARNARRAELRDVDRGLAEDVGALKRAAPAAWLASLLAREEPERLDDLVALGGELRSALENADRDSLARLADARRESLRAATDAAQQLAAEHDVTASRAVLDDVAETLQAAMGDAGAEAAVRSGLLVRPLESSGFDAVDLDGALAVDDGAPAAPPRPRLRRVKDPDAELARARREAAEALEEAQHRLAEAEDAGRAHGRRLREAETSHGELAEEVGRLEAELSRARRSLNDAGAEVREARSERARIERALELARDAVEEAEQRRDRFR
ncbi:MAG TPA: hypothetical protein VKZ73_03785 [Microbacterium sp.]|nr:hypothetical protein [Microbacterium sp.]